jgi:formylglycine-generating enzyme required for sulfatase activity/dienelactone hydrolase
MAIAAAGVLLALLAIWFLRSNARVRWAKEQAIPEIQRLVSEGDYGAAFALATQAEIRIPEDPVLTRLWPEFSASISLETDPPGADVYLKPYESVNEEWEHLGQTPIVQKRIPRGYFRWRVEKKEFRALERAGTATGGFSAPWSNELTRSWPLVEESNAPRGMVPVPGGTVGMRITALDHLPDVDLPDFWVDRFEVTNKEFKEFVDQGGYQKREFWKEPFIRDGHELSWEEALREFRDATGRPGPSAWELGVYAKGKDDHPVSGVSWFEAAAYAEFAGKRLPTAYHWSRAAGTAFAADTIARSNIDGRAQGMTPVGIWSGMSGFGAYDMAGNAREWCWNEGRSGKRYILGGAWNEPSYMFTDVNAQSPWDRSETNGFRCVRSTSDSALPDQAMGLLFDAFRDFSREKPVPEEIFRIYQSLYSYDRTPLNAVVESVDETDGKWRVEKVSFDAAYGAERVIAYLFLPRQGTPPFQTVVYFDGAGAIFDRSFEMADTWAWSGFLVESGRALLFPIYKGTFDRGDALSSDYPAETSFYREHAIQWANDLGRSIDYLETRSDIDVDRLAFYGASWGASQPQLLAVEDRFKAAVLYSGGFYFTKTLPEVDPINFAPRVRLPLLMLNGRSDYFYPLETSQLPLYRSLGTPAQDKRHVLFDSGHLLPRNEVIRETLDWLDRYLGPVK